MSSPTSESKKTTMAAIASAAQEARTCANCHKPASQACTGCKDAPIIHSTDTIQTTYYCSTECQKYHWSTHKPVCKTIQARKYLQRAGTLLQDIFLMYREKMFDKLVDRIEERDGKLLVYEGDYGDAIDQILFPFPTEVVGQKKENWMTWMGVLTHQACGEIAWLGDLISYLLSDIAIIFEAEVIIANPLRQVLPANNIEENDPHNLFYILLKQSEEEYALDLAGAQYGYYDPVVPWSTYIFSRTFMKQCAGYNPLGTLRNTLLDSRMEIDLFKEVGNSLTGVININAKIHPDLMAGVRAWDTTEGRMGVKQLLKGSKKAFEENRGDLVRFVGGFIENGLEKWKKGLEASF